MSEIEASLRGPEEPRRRPADSDRRHGRPSARSGPGPTYYGRPALKQAPFNNWVVGGYVFLAGLAGSASILAAIADATAGAEAAAGTVRRGRYLPLLAPTIGAALLVWDLHTPQRFYNMFRVAKRTSPMSIGTWILTGFSLSSGLSAALQFLADRGPRWPWARRAARVANVPAAVLGGGMGTYTAALLSATSTPLWAAAPRAMAAHFGAASMASGAAALSLGEPPGRDQVGARHGCLRRARGRARRRRGAGGHLPPHRAWPARSRAAGGWRRSWARPGSAPRCRSGCMALSLLAGQPRQPVAARLARDPGRQLAAARSRPWKPATSRRATRRSASASPSPTTCRSVAGVSAAPGRHRLSLS